MTIEEHCYEKRQEDNLVSYFLRVNSVQDASVILHHISKYIKENIFTAEHLICSIYVDCAMIRIYPANEEDEFSEKEYLFTISLESWQNIEEPYNDEIYSAINLLHTFAKNVEQTTEKLVKIAHYVWDDINGMNLQYDKVSKYA
ncbi:MAG: hypothetical protein ACFHVJ_05125 [Aestuariibacter sp.]